MINFLHPSESLVEFFLQWASIGLPTNIGEKKHWLCPEDLNQEFKLYSDRAAVTLNDLLKDHPQGRFSVQPSKQIHKGRYSFAVRKLR